MKLRNYQQKAVDIANRDEKEIHLELATGSGKSCIIAEIIRTNYKERPVVVLTNISALIDQLRSHIEAFGLELNIIKHKKHKVSKNSNIWLIMEQSFHDKKREQYNNLKGSLIIKDEIHIGYNGKRYKDIISFLEPHKIIGLSATPYTEIGTFLNNNIIPYKVLDTPDAIKQGWLVPIKWYKPKIANLVDYSDVKLSGNDYNTDDLYTAMNTDKFISAFKDFCKKIELNKNHTLVMCSNIEQAEQIGAIINEIEPTVVVHSKQDDEFNEKAISMFKDGDIRVLVSVSKLNVGFDAPIANQLINLRRTKVLRLCLQSFGRVLRLHKNKKYAKVYDIGGWLEEFGFVDEMSYMPQIDKHNYRKIIQENIENDNADKLDEIVNILDKDIIEISKSNIKVLIEEVERKKKEVYEKQDINELIKLYDSLNNIKEILQVGSTIYDLIYGTNTKQSTLKWIYDKWLNDAFMILPQKSIYFTKVLKTRFKNIIIKEKKVASLYYFCNFIIDSLKKNEYWLFEAEPTEQDNIYINEDEIPF